MFGGGAAKREDGLPAISSSNSFSALESRRKKSNKKKSEKEKGSNLIKEESALNGKETQAVWTATPVSVTSWADCEEDDDDDYFAMPALPPLPTDQAKYASEIASPGADDGDDDEEDEDEYASHGEVCLSLIRCRCAQYWC